MKKLFSCFAIVIALFLISPAYAEYQDMIAKVYKWSGGYNQDGSPTITAATSSIAFKVLSAGSDNAETIYLYRTFTSLTNPVEDAAFTSASSCNAHVAFRVDPTHSGDRYVDLIVNDNYGGYSVYVPNFDKYTHTIVIDERPNVEHHGIVWFSGATTDITDTGVRFQPKQNVRFVRTEVVTALAGAQIAVGGVFDANSNGLLKVHSLATAGQVTLTANSGGSVLSNAASEWYPGGYAVTSSAKSLAFKVSSTGGQSSVYPKGYIHYWHTKGR